jgi:mRNA deadenylase 3'-5' endonuclease subunit Ccr4
MEKPQINFNVITFNVGTPFSFTPSEYPDCDPAILDRLRRKNAILSLFTIWLRTNPIIVLQEVPYNWKQDFDRYFTKRYYTFHCMNYGQKKNGILGVGIAVPASYAINPEEVEFIRVADYIKCDIDSSDDHSSDNEVDTNIENAKKRANLVVRMKIHLNNGKSFYLYNYHMPCAFKTPLVQILHIQALKRIIASFPDIPYILAGDMNVLPTSKEYKFLTIALKDTSSPCPYLNTLPPITLKSSYNIANKEEPEFTCFNYTTFGGEFCGCLDYIFVSDEFKVLKSHLLLTTKTELPNADCPSDHLPLRSVLSL